jgi:DNA-binding transcriptional ArsR family regulator
MADIFDVVADATRRDVLQVLLDRYLSTDANGGEISVGEIVTALGQSQPTVSKHLKVLRDHGLVVVREEGQHRYYSLDAGPLEELEDWLIPFLSADFDDGAAGEGDGVAGDDETAVFAAWAGADVGETIGRRVAEGTHQARTVIHDATEQVTRRLPKIVRRRPFRKP